MKKFSEFLTEKDHNIDNLIDYAISKDSSLRGNIKASKDDGGIHVKKDEIGYKVVDALNKHPKTKKYMWVYDEDEQIVYDEKQGF